MNTVADILATLIRLNGDPLSGVSLQPAADKANIRLMQATAKQHFEEPVPDESAKILQVTNGLQINGAYFKSAEYLIPENLDVFRPEIIVLGTEGNTAEFVFDLRDRRFHTINMGFPNERFASFDTFAELLVTVFREQHAI